ncbi:MAG: hypothetical protein ABI261_07900 [Ginsengibacter sp.]
MKHASSPVFYPHRRGATIVPLLFCHNGQRAFAMHQHRPCPEAQGPPAPHPGPVPLFS